MSLSCHANNSNCDFGSLASTEVSYIHFPTINSTKPQCRDFLASAGNVVDLQRFTTAFVNSSCTFYEHSTLGLSQNWTFCRCNFCTRLQRWNDWRCPSGIDIIFCGRWFVLVCWALSWPSDDCKSQGTSHQSSNFVDFYINDAETVELVELVVYP